MITKLLEEVRKQGQNFSHQFGGMPSSSLSINPYNHKWRASISWSDSTYWYIEDDDAEQALKLLLSIYLGRSEPWENS